DAAIGWYERARGVFEELNQPANAALVTGNIGDVLKDRGHWRQAQAAYQQAIDIFQELRDLERQSETLFALGNLYRTQNKVDAEKASYQQAVELYNRNWDAHLALGLLQFDDEPGLAEQACRHALDGLPVHEILAHVGLAIAAAGRGELSQVQAEIETTQSLLAVAQKKYTVVELHWEALRIVVSALDAPEQALQDSQAFDLSAVPVDERDLIEIAFGYLSILAKWLLSDSQASG
ncbi:MAG: tetratricopeptide repeat protein, partial [Anaerolineales bacterium]